MIASICSSVVAQQVQKRQKRLPSSFTIHGTSSRKRFDNKFDSFAESEQPLSRVDFLPIR